jgi:hypothetical protein
MTSSPPRRLWLAMPLLLVLSGACSSDRSAVAPVVAAAEPAEPSPYYDENPTDPVRPAEYTSEGDELLLEERTDGAHLYGTVQPMLLDTDEEPVWVIRTELDGQPVEPALEGARVRDASFLPHGMVLIGEDHVLRSCIDGEMHDLDGEALGPLSIGGDADGPVVAYVRGSMPFYELARADIGQGVAGAITTDMAPVWSPAVSPDGRQIVFVSGITGVPRLYRIAEGGRPELLPETDSFPSSLGAPQFDGTTLRYEDETGGHHTLVIGVPRIEGSTGTTGPTTTAPRAAP